MPYAPLVTPLLPPRGGGGVVLTFLLQAVGCTVQVPFVRVDISCHSDTNVCHRHGCLVPLLQQLSFDRRTLIWVR